MDAGENRQADWAANARLSIGGGEPHHLALSLDGWLGEDPNHTQNGLYGYAGVGLSFEMM